MQAYWKRSTKEGSRIALDETLTHIVVEEKYTTSTLRFNARQKNKINCLYICQENNRGEKVGEIYLSGREVIMLDVAIGKAINMLSPTDDRLEKDPE